MMEPPDVPVVPMRIRLAVPLMLVVVAAFTVATLLYNAPPSPARNRLAPAAIKVLQPYFWQDWQLFGPNPPARDGLVYLQARVADGTGSTRELAPVEVEQAIDRAPRKFRINPTKTPGIMLAFNASANNFARADLDIRKLPADRRQAAKLALAQRYTTFFLEVQRFLSATAATLYPGQHVTAVKAVFKSRAIVPFSQRDQHPAPEQPAKELLDTTWMPYVPGVAR